MSSTMDTLLPRDNDALKVNRPVANNNITTDGSNLDWAICALHAVLLLGVLGYTFVTNSRRRVFNYFSISILLVATIYYFTLASNLGSHGVPVQFGEGNILNRTRQVFWARWVGYFINFSLAYFALMLMSGVGWAEVLYTVGLTMLWATMLLVGALVRTSYKWGFFVFSLFLWGLLVWQVMGVARNHAKGWNDATGKTFLTLAAWELFLMMLYHISWGVSEGGNKISNDSEQIFYAVLDTLSQGVFALLLLLLTKKLDLRRLRLEAHEGGRVGGDHGLIEHGKRNHGSTGYHNGTGTTSGAHQV